MSEVGSIERLREWSGDLPVVLTEREQSFAALASVEIARRLTEAIWWMLSRNQPFAPAGAL